ncbi:HPP family protein [Halorientalis brevis]|uniref:HPP family protein n=1 Tax=Halorientalis brevis TaxID=1126241 RepID=A0ABD6CDB1_9EURY|nr:HPP family protein [Halorientalis brevis]
MRPIRESLTAGSLLVVTGALAWATGQPFVFPSLGPSAYLLATTRPGSIRGRELVGGHLVGIVAGLAAYHAFATGTSIMTTEPGFTTAQLRLVASAVTAVTLTTGGMRLTGTGHAPACATTLIVSLGLLTTPTEATIIAVSVVTLYLAFVALDGTDLAR